MKTLHELTSTPTSPATNDLLLYAKDDDQLYTLNSTGEETQLGRQSSGTTINQIQVNGGDPVYGSDGSFASTPTATLGWDDISASLNLSGSDSNAITLSTSEMTGYLSLSNDAATGTTQISSIGTLTIYGGTEDVGAPGIIIEAPTTNTIDFSYPGFLGPEALIRISMTFPGVMSFLRAGSGIAIKEDAARAKQGLVTLIAGTATVTNAAVTADSRIQLTNQTGGTAPGTLYVSARTPGVDFTISSTSATDDADVAYFITEPA